MSEQKTAKDLLDAVARATKEAREAALRAALRVHLRIEDWAARMPPMPEGLKSKVAVLSRTPNIQEAIAELTVLAEAALREIGWGYGASDERCPRPSDFDAGFDPRSASAVANPQFEPLWRFCAWLEQEPYTLLQEEMNRAFSGGERDFSLLTGKALIL